MEEIIVVVKMYLFKLYNILFLLIFHVTDCNRRITNGQVATAEKGYVVYLIKAPNSDKIYDEWLCGGALVSTLFIVTSAACVVDVEYMYAIAGYKKYVKDSEVETDRCTQQKKKKIVFTCVPMKYHLDYEKTEMWSFIDIALVKVESPYNLDDTSYKDVCSYKPAVIPINYEPRFQKPDTDTLMFGWGHSDIWREEGDVANYNMEYLQYTSSRVIDKNTCKKNYEQYPDMNKVIDQYMICTNGRGDFNDKGELIIVPPKVDGCSPKFLKSPDGEFTGYYTGTDKDCVDNITTFDDTLIDQTRRDENINKTTKDSFKKSYKNRTTRINKNGTASNSSTGPSRKNGICQNDHGGPLVTWMGGTEVLIGVASVFRVMNNLKCTGPYLFTSTQCNGAFLDCILSKSNLPDTKNRRAICNSPPIQRGYDTVERLISWAHHPSGPADNERYNATTEPKPQATQNLALLSMLSKLARDQTEKMMLQGQMT